MDIRSEVEEIIKRRWKGLREPEVLISAYNIEKQTNQGYNGRQLLELFQNCEDEGASEVNIFLDTTSCRLEISNNGNKPFSIEGYKSILYPGLSSKVSTSYIGNKGLGFRSIINWANEVCIVSNGFEMVFNVDFKREILLNEIEYTEQELEELRAERKLNKGIYPIPFLNCCKTRDLHTDDKYTTTISIKYKKDYEDDIIKQLNSISLKTLLFLQNINTIIIEGNVLNTTISVNRKYINVNEYEIEHNNDTYYILSDEGVVDEDLITDKELSNPKRYNVKIAYNNDLSFRDDYFYNFFKTQIPFQLPFVVHASLELDQNRNHSTESKVNPYVLNKLFNLHLTFIEILKRKYKRSWIPYKTIDLDNINIYDAYKKIIIENRARINIYPTLSGEYHTQDIAKDLGNDIAKFMQENGLDKCFGQQIAFRDLKLDLEDRIKLPEAHSKILENIAEGLDNVRRAKYVKLLLNSYPNEKFSVLIDENDQLINLNDFVFTDKTSENKDLKAPSYSKIRFINPGLYTELIKECELESELNKSRALKDRLEKISDIHSFEPQTVIKKIISETNDIINRTENQELIINTINEFYQVLFHNYRSRKENFDLDYDGVIPCLNAENNVKNIRELVLSDEFEIGKLSKKIFEKLYDKSYTLTRITNLGLSINDIEDVEVFLLWLGINHLSIIKPVTSDMDQEYLLEVNKTHNINTTSYKLYTLWNFDDTLSKSTITINHVIAWLSLDKKLKDIFSNFTISHFDSEEIKYYYRGSKYLANYKNYIYYKIQKKYRINNYLVTNKKEEWFNPFKIDYEYLKQINKTLDKSEVDRILVFFGAKRDFNDLEIEYLKEKTKELSEKNNPKGAQIFYKYLVSHYRENGKELSNVPLYAKEGLNIVVKNSNEIYFSDRIQLPDYLTNKFPILYYPSRSGGASAIKMFNLNDLNNLDLKIIQCERNKEIEVDFSNYLKEVKPFILAFRLDKISKEEVKKAQVQLLNKLRIVCCDRLECQIESEVFDIEPYNYIYSNNEFYINVPRQTTIDTLKQNKQFINTLSDIYLKVFDTLDEKKIFESVLKQSKEQNVYDVNNELAEGVLEDAMMLLGEISIRLSIWKSIFTHLGHKNVTNINENNLDEYITTNFANILPEDFFDSDSSINEIVRIKNVFDKLKISLEDYNKNTDYKLSFDRLFNVKLKEYYDAKKKMFKNQLWGHLETKDISEQEGFVSNLYKIEHLLHEVELTDNASAYDFDKIIEDQLKKALPFMQFEMNNDAYEDYDKIETLNIQQFTSDEILVIRKDEKLNSLSFFENRIDFIKTEIKKKMEHSNENVPTFELNSNLPAELIENFDIELNPNELPQNHQNGPWLGNGDELSPGNKKSLGTNVEKIVKDYLESMPDKYSKVEHISKVSEGEHYDIKYYDINENKIKYVECKYYNGFSFLLTREEKLFADKHSEQYEVWLVNKESKIFCIDDINKLGDLKPANYKVNIRLKAMVSNSSE